jgi:hypothetical protein
VERVKPLRFAEASGRYDAVFKQRNDSAEAWLQGMLPTGNKTGQYLT